MPFAVVCLWEIAWLLSIFGYGAFLLRLFKLEASAGLSGAAGVSLLVAIGGVLNLFGLVRPPVLAALVGIGLILLAGTLFRSRRDLRVTALEATTVARRHPILSAQVLLLTALFAIPVCGNMRGHAFHVWGGFDDPNAYFAFPEQMLQLGSLSADPFSERRIETSLGGGYFLQAVVLAPGDIRAIPFPDVALGYILIITVLFELGRKRGLTYTQLVLVYWLLFLLPFGRINASMVLLPSGLFAAAILLQDQTDLKKDRLRKAALLALILSAICVMKSTYLPTAVLTGALYYLLQVTRSSRKHLVSTLVCFGTGILCMLPWMLDMKRKEGTYLFPLFGRGYEASSYNPALVAAGSLSSLLHSSFFWEEAIFYALPLLLAAAAMLLVTRRSVEPKPLGTITALLAGSLGTMAVDVAVGGESLGRYCQPFLIPALLALAIAIFGWWQHSPVRPRWLLLTASLTAIYLFAFSAVSLRTGGLQTFFRDIRPTPELVFPLDAAQVARHGAAMQAVVPAGAAVFARVVWSHPFDFTRNRIYIGDFPGMSSAPPGMPLGKGPEALRSYLLGQGIRYVFFDYRELYFAPAPLPLDTMLAGLPVRHHWTGVQRQVAGDVQTNLLALGETSRHLYDDGGSFVLDLGCPAEIGMPCSTQP